MELTAKHRSSATKIGLTLAAAGALALGSLTPAYAADIYIGPGDVAGYEVGGDGTDPAFNYDQWHVGSVSNSALDAEASLQFNEHSVTTLAVPADSGTSAGVTQVLKGYAPDARPAAGSLLGAEGASAISSVIYGTSIDVVGGDQVTLQFPMFHYSTADSSDYFTTVRTGNLPAGVTTLGEDTPITGTGALWTEPGELFDGVSTLGELFEQIEGDVDAPAHGFELLGVGFTGADGAEVASLSFGGDTYYFGTGSAPANTGLVVEWDPNPATNVCPAATATSTVTGVIENFDGNAYAELHVGAGELDEGDEIDPEDYIIEAEEIDINDDGTFSIAVEGLEAGTYTAGVYLGSADGEVFEIEYVTVTIGGCDAPTPPKKVDTAA